MKGLDILSRVLGQITSGRWLITVTAAFCLILLTKTLCTLMEQGKIVLESATYIAIVMSVLNVVSTISIFYFNKPRPDGNGDTTTTTDTDISTHTTNVTDTTTTLPPKP
jgi:hypothetical protein